MSRSYNKRKKAIKNFLKDKNSRPAFKNVDGQWKIIPETNEKED